MDIVADRVRGAEREIELKLLAAPDVLARLRRSPLVGRHAQGHAVTRPLLSVYYDTPDLALRRKGMALRVRKKGPVHVQTVKTEDASGAASNRAELEALLPDDRPDPERIADEDLRRFVIRRAAGGGLRPIYETDIRRTERQLVTPEGDRVELAIDTGVIRADGREEPVSELEFELKHGSPAALFRLARPIVEQFCVRLGVLSKAARGYALATGESGIAPVKATAPALDPSMNVEEACCAVLGACMAQIVGNEPAVVTARDPEGVHQMRVGLRRLRSATVPFSQAGLEPWLAPLAEEARRFASILGRARDLDVFVDEMLAPVEDGMDGHAVLARLRAEAQARREAAWEEAGAAIASRRFALFVLSVAAAVEERPWRQPAGEAGAAPADILASPVRDLARRVLQDHHARVKSKAQAFDRLTTEQRHALRIELKKLRYTADFFAGLFPKKGAKPFIKPLSKLQDTFGYLNDAAVARRMARKLAKRAPDGKKGALREAAGTVAGWHGHLAAEEWKKARKRWQAFEKIAPFWG
ncbi:MAG: CHAD domain-containing protein, partial [Alphaproteobacteria bacterium]